MSMQNAVALAEPRPQLVAGGKLSAIVPQTMDEAYRMARAVCMAGMAPKGMDTPEKAMIAIMRGMEVGLTPFQALDKIAVVNGRPTIWGDGAMALVRGSGICEFIRETIEGEADGMVATCKAKRKGEPEPIVGVFSVADAKKAGLWGKQGPWQQFPKRMLQMRARAFALRDGFADVLGGLYLREEIEDSSARPAPPSPAPEPMNYVAPTSMDRTHGAPSKKLPPAPPPLPALSPPKPEPAVPAAFDFVAYRADLDAAETLDAANAIYADQVERRTPPLTGDEQDEADNILREIGAKFWNEGE